MKLCKIPGCRNLARADELCSTHLSRREKGQDLAAPVRKVNQRRTDVRAKPRGEVHDALEKAAAAKGTSIYKLVDEILEKWYRDNL